jgi:hypothetical protein
MKSQFTCGTLLTTVLLIASGCTLNPTKSANPATIQEVVNEIDKALLEVQNELLKDQEMHAKDNNLALLPFESAEVELETTVAEEDGATFKLLVITIGTKISHATTQTISFKLTKPSVPKGLIALKQPPHEALAKAIIAASRELRASLKDHKNLDLHDLSASIKFEVSKSPVSGEIGIDIGSVTIGASHSRTTGFAHSITLNYAKDDKG